MEVWKEIKEGLYEVSSAGKVRRSAPTKPNACGKKGVVGYVLKPQFDGRYLHVRLGLGKRGIKIRTVHSLVAEAFISKKLKGFQVNHKDGNKLNNNLENIEYITVSKNATHALDTGLRAHGEKSTNAKLSDSQVYSIKRRLDKGESCLSISHDFNVGATAIYWIRKNRNWKRTNLEVSHVFT